MAVTDMTVRHYVDVLASTFMVRVLPPWHENLSKRQVKAPKLYIRDSGLLHTLLDIQTLDQLESHPKLGASFEGFCVEAILGRVGARADQCYFWATHGGAELDLLVVAGERRRGFEIKRTVAPRVTPSMLSALADLRLESLDVVHAGTDTFPLGRGIRALALSRLLSDVAPVGARRV
jgi:predicted AAA+ superfamily ATPase